MIGVRTANQCHRGDGPSSYLRGVRLFAKHDEMELLLLFAKRLRDIYSRTHHIPYAMVDRALKSFSPRPRKAISS